MSDSLGVQELMIVLSIAVFWLLPIAAAVWALVTLNRIAVAQHAIGATLERIERLLQRGSDVG
jgi:membrane protein YdbS with pleckstrin-like domain